MTDMSLKSHFVCLVLFIEPHGRTRKEIWKTGEKLREEPCVQSLSTLCIEKITQMTTLTSPHHNFELQTLNLIYQLLAIIMKNIFFGLFSRTQYASPSYKVDELYKKLPRDLLTQIIRLKRKQLQK